jgi:hypothetical protein
MIQTDLLPAFGVDVGAAREYLAGQRLNARRCNATVAAAGVLPVCCRYHGRSQVLR